MEAALSREFLAAVSEPVDTTYLTHNFHPFAAKFVPQIPRLLIQKYTRPSETALDPFCGSGTSLVEARLLGRKSIGVDINEIAAFVSRVKSTKVRDSELELVSATIRRAREGITDFYGSWGRKRNLDSFSSDSVSSTMNYVLPEFPNRDHWFKPEMLHELAIIRSAILGQQCSAELRDFLLLGLSSIIVACSNQDSETRYAAIEKELPPRYAINMFEKKIEDMVERTHAFNRASSDAEALVYCGDTRSLSRFVPPSSVHFVVTSPPYPNTYDYYLYHKMRMFWLGLDWEKAKFNEIGSRLRHSSQQEDISSYVRDMTQCFDEIWKAMMPGRNFAIVIGDSVIDRVRYDGSDLVKQIAKETDFAIENAFKYDLGLSSKVFNKAFRQSGKSEHVLILRKDGKG